MKKIVPVVGILFALAAAEGSNRFGGLVSAFGGADSSLYMMFLIVSIISAGAFIGILLGKSNKLFRYGLIVLNIISVVLLLNAPALDVVYQIVGGMAVTSICLFLCKEEASG